MGGSWQIARCIADQKIDGACSSLLQCSRSQLTAVLCSVKQNGGRYHGGRRPSSDDSLRSSTVIPPSALDKPSIMKRYYRRQTTRWGVTARSLTMVTLHDTRFVECRWWNDGWIVKTVVTWRSSASMIPAPGTLWSTVVLPQQQATHTFRTWHLDWHVLSNQLDNLCCGTPAGSEDSCRVRIQTEQFLVLGFLIMLKPKT